MNESVALPAKRTALGGQMDLAQLQVFLTVARERSFSRAAEKLYRTQPAVSITIRKLEESVGQPLFQRGARAAARWTSPRWVGKRLWRTLSNRRFAGG